MFHAFNRTTIRSPVALLAAVASRAHLAQRRLAAKTTFEEYEQLRASYIRRARQSCRALTKNKTSLGWPSSGIA